MKRGFASAILCLAVVAMLAGMAYAGGGITNIDPVNTVGCWLFDSEVTAGPRVPGNPVASYPPDSLGEIVDSAGGDNNATAVGRLYNGNGDVNDPANYHNTFAPYDLPSTGNGTEPCSIRLNYYGGNETGAGVPPYAIQTRVDCPSRESMGDWDLLVGHGGKYTIEAVIKPEARGVDEDGWTSGRHDFWEGIVTDLQLIRPSEGAANYPGWYLRTAGNDNDGTAGLDFCLYTSASSYVTLRQYSLGLLDGNWHHVAMVIDSNEVNNVGTTTVKMYCDNVLVAQTSANDLVDCTPSQNPDYPPPYWWPAGGPQPYTDAMWIGDMQGRWDDQFIGCIDGVAFTDAALLPGLAPVVGNFVLNRAPEPSSIVLLVMGALALLAIRRVR